MKTIFLVICSVSLMAAGKCSKKPLAPAADHSALVQIEMHGCRGYCPTYKLLFRNDGLVEYEGVRNMLKMGRDSIKLSDVELKHLLAATKELNLWQYPEQIQSRVADAPTSTITVFKDGKSHPVTGSIDRPKPILTFEALLKDLAEAHGLKVKQGVNPYESPANQKELLVKFKPDVNPGNFMMQLEDLKLRIVRRVSTENVWIIGYNPDLLTEQEVIETLKSKDGVLEAGPNK